MEELSLLELPANHGYMEESFTFERVGLHLWHIFNAR